MFVLSHPPASYPMPMRWLGAWDLKKHDMSSIHFCITLDGAHGIRPDTAARPPALRNPGEPGRKHGAFLSTRIDASLTLSLLKIHCCHLVSDREIPAQLEHAHPHTVNVEIHRCHRVFGREIAPQVTLTISWTIDTQSNSTDDSVWMG